MRIVRNRRSVRVLVNLLVGGKGNFFLVAPLQGPRHVDSNRSPFDKDRKRLVPLRIFLGMVIFVEDKDIPTP